jgi:archaellum component FlaC
MFRKEIRSRVEVLEEEVKDLKLKFEAFSKDIKQIADYLNNDNLLTSKKKRQKYRIIE